jgi:hypothetical protein
MRAGVYGESAGHTLIFSFLQESQARLAEAAGACPVPAGLWATAKLVYMASS